MSIRVALCQDAAGLMAYIRLLRPEGLAIQNESQTLASTTFRIISGSIKSFLV